MSSKIPTLEKLQSCYQVSPASGMLICSQPDLPNTCNKQQRVQLTRSWEPATAGVSGTDLRIWLRNPSVFQYYYLSQVRNPLLSCLQTFVKELLSLRVYFLSFELFSGHRGQTFKEAMISLEYQLICWKSPIQNGNCQAGVLCTWSVCSVLRRRQLSALRSMDSVWKLITLPPGDAPSGRNRFKERRFDSLKTNLRSHLRLCQDWCYYKRRETINSLIS